MVAHCQMKIHDWFLVHNIMEQTRKLYYVNVMRSGMINVISLRIVQQMSFDHSDLNTYGILHRNNKFG